MLFSWNAVEKPTFHEYLRSERPENAKLKEQLHISLAEYALGFIT